MDSKKIEIFEKLPVSQAVWKLATPTIIGMIVMVFYNMVDTFFIGLTNDANQVAAVSLAMPIFMILMSFGGLFGIGASANISRYLGAKQFDKVKNFSSFAFWGGIAIGIISSILFLTNMDTLVDLTGSDELAAPYVSGYLTYIAIGAPFIILGNTLSYLIRSEGNAKAAMIGMTVSTIINIILDPIFIFALDLGVAGAAVATVIANVISTVYYIVVIINMENSHLSLRLKDLRFGDVAKKTLVIGTPASLNNILMSTAFVVYNSYLASYGNDPVAAMGIVMKVTMMYIMIFVGLTIGTQPLLGYSYGAKHYERLKKTINYILMVTAIVGIVCFAVFFFGAEWIIAAFIRDSAVIEYGIIMLRAQIITTPFIGIIFVVTNLMQVANKGMISLILSVCRQGLVFIPAIILLDYTLGFNGLVYAQAVADVMSVILSTIVYIWFIRKIMVDKI